jgi:hypothetical protein
MALTPDELRAWASAYIAAEEQPASAKPVSPHWWAMERFMNLYEISQAEDAWSAILEVLSMEPSQQVVGMLAAGALEDLIEDWGPQFIERIELQARQNPAFRHLLGGVWRSSTPEVWQRIERARIASW